MCIHESLRFNNKFNITSFYHSLVDVFHSVFDLNFFINAHTLGNIHVALR